MWSRWSRSRTTPAPAALLLALAPAVAELPAAAWVCDTELAIAGAAPGAAHARLQCTGQGTGALGLALVLPGQAPLDLRGVDGESLLAEHLRFDPASLIVRWLPGPPARYWVTYRHARDWEPGSANIEHRRDLLVAADASERAWFDHWGFAHYDFSRASVFYGVADDLTLVADGPVLRLRASRYRDEVWDDPGSAHFACEEACGADDAAAITAAPRSVCERECLRAWLKSANHEASLEIRDHLLPVDVGSAVTPSWAKQFQPLTFAFAARPGEAPLTLLVLDDGSAGWLIVPAAPVELTLDGGFDPSAPAPIPATASCWLYNRRPWTPADAARAYPPAPAAALRPDHAAPPDCCEVETSPDGQRVLVWAKAPADAPASDDARPARQLLALYHLPSRQCWSMQLARPGPLGQAPYDRMGDPVFSPDGRRVGWRAQRGEARFVVVDGQEGPIMRRVSAPVFSPDGHVAYWARAEGREFIVVDGTPGARHAGAGLPVFSPTGGPPAWRANDGKAWWVIRGERAGPRFEEIGSFRVDPTGRVNDLADLVFSARGELAYAARRGHDWFIVRDGHAGAAWEAVGLPVYSPDGARLAHRARRDGHEFIVVDGEPGPAFAFVGTPVFSPDGRTLAHWASDGGQEFVVWDGQPGPAVAPPGRVGEPAFADAGGPPWFLVLEDAQPFVQHGRIAQGTRTVRPLLGPHGRVSLNRRTGHVAWWEQDGALAQVVTSAGGRPESYMIDDLSPPPLIFSPDGRLLAHAGERYVPGSESGSFSPDGRLLAAAAGRDGLAVLNLGAGDGHGFAAVGDPVFSPTGERLGYRAAIAGRWWPVVVPVAALLPGETAPTASPPAPALPATAVLRGVVPRLLPHPVAVPNLAGGLLIGGSGAGHWYGTDAIVDGLGAEAARASHAHGGCVPVGPEWLAPGPRFRLYGFDRALGACTGTAVAACFSDGNGLTHADVTLADCAVQGWQVAVAGPWDALPRRPRVVVDSGPFAPLVRRVLDGGGRTAAPVAIAAVHAIDLDGNSSEELIIVAGHVSGEAPEDSADDYALLLLARGARDPAPAIIEVWWGGEADGTPMGQYHPFYADLNGDGVLEILVNWNDSVGMGTRVHALIDDQPQATPLGWFDDEP